MIKYLYFFITLLYLNAGQIVTMTEEKFNAQMELENQEIINLAYHLSSLVKENNLDEVQEIINSLPDEKLIHLYEHILNINSEPLINGLLNLKNNPKYFTFFDVTKTIQNNKLSNETNKNLLNYFIEIINNEPLVDEIFESAAQLYPWIIKYQNTKLAEILMQNNFFHTTLDPEEKKWLEAVRLQTQKNIDLLNAAKLEQYSDCIKAITDGANPNARNYKDFLKTALMYIINNQPDSHEKKDNRFKVMQSLLISGANPNLCDANKNAAINTRRLNSKEIKLLLEYNADPNTPNCKDHTILSIFLNSAWLDSEDISSIKLLLKSGATLPDKISKKGQLILNEIQNEILEDTLQQLAQLHQPPNNAVIGNVSKLLKPETTSRRSIMKD